MSKTWRKSLPTALLALCLLIAQAALLVNPSTSHAAVVTTGPAIYVSPGTSTYGVAAALKITGTGFNADSPVLITFNAPYSTDGRPPVNGRVVNTVPPTVNRPGDSRTEAPEPNPVAIVPFPNVIQVIANADGNGNLVAANTNSGVVPLYLPQNTADGVYTITAWNAAGDKLAATQYTVTQAPGQNLQVQPVSGPSAQIDGVVRVTSPSGTFNNGDQVYFYLDDFAASNTIGLLTGTGLPPTGNPPDQFNYTIPSNTPDVLAQGLGTAIPLVVVSCGVQFSTTTVYGSGSPINNACPASANGDLNAFVQIRTAPVTAPATAFPNILSWLTANQGFYDQVFSIVAANVPPNNINHVPGQPYNPSGRLVSAGFHLDHGFTKITLSTNQVAVGGAFVVSGTGFGAQDQVQLYFVPVTGTVTDNGTYFSSPYPMGTATTDNNGAFTTTVAVSGTAFGGIIGTFGNGAGFVLAEDFGGSTNASMGLPNQESGLRLNEAATAAVSLTGLTGTGTIVIQPQVVAAGAALGSTATAAISSTVTVTATGFLPNEAVNITLAGSGANSTVLPLGSPHQPPNTPITECNTEVVAIAQANAGGAAVASFLVPEDCNTVTVRTSDGGVNGGSTASLAATGEQSGVSSSGTLTFPPTSATITPIYGITQSGAVGPALLNGYGFAANEPVTFQFGTTDPFTGASVTPVLTISSTSDANGNVTISSALSAYLAGGLYTLVARGLASGFSSLTNVGVPFVFVNGNLNCPTGTVYPGQVFTVTGSGFAPGYPILVTLTPQNGLPQSASVALAAPLFVQTVIAGPGGTFVVTPTIPLGTPPGLYNLTFSGLVVNQASGDLTQQLRECVLTVGSPSPTITDNPNIGPIGTTTTVLGTGFPANEPIQLSLQYVDSTGVLTGTDVPGTAQVITPTTSTGAFTATYIVKSTINALIPGAYNLTAKGLNTGVIARTPFTVTALPSQPLNTVYFAEGYTGTVAAGANADFNETLSILNANNYTTTYTVTYSLENGASGVNPVSGAASSTKVVSGLLGPNSVVERSVNTDAGANQRVAAQVSSPAPLAASRIITRSNAGKPLDASSSLGTLLNLSATAPSGGFNYLFASGEVTLTNEQYLTLLNPNSTTANVTVNILPQAVISATTVPTIPALAVTVLANSRVTVPIRAYVEKAGSGIVHFGMEVNSNVPIAAERVEYFGNGIGSGKYGATAAPAGDGTGGFRQYIFASDTGTFPSAGGNASAGTGNDISSVDIVNPGTAAGGSATVTVSFFAKNGQAINSQQVQVDGQTRETVSVNDVVGTQADVFSVIVTSDKAIYVEKLTSYGGDPSLGGTFAVNDNVGSPAGLTSVALPSLDTTFTTGAPISQTVYLYNPGATSITVRGTYISSTTSAPVVKTYTVAANSITAVNVNADSATLPAGAIGGLFQIVNLGTNTGDSFVASQVGNTASFSIVIGDQGTYPLGFATGS